jgi:DNA mismatch repair protein MutL
MEQPSAEVTRSIAILGPEVVERIAAGEVIERPASVVRELIENALDAGATTIRVDIREGGLRLIRVSDDGCGILPAELDLAVAAHATSKVRQLADLGRIRTLGFRGEALASVAAVAEVHVSSACDATGVAHSLTVVAGLTIDRGLDPRPRGTTVTVRELFRDMPARRAALHGPRGEEARTLTVVRAYALAHPIIRFTMSSDGALVLQTPGTSPEAAAAAIYGADVARALVSIGAIVQSAFTITGWIAPRSFSQADRAHVLLGINGRPVSNRGLLAAVEAGYRPLLRKGRHPIACILVEAEPDEVDVNVHPAKAEVLLRSERAVAAGLRAAIHSSLGTEPSAPTPSSPFTGGSYSRARQYPLPLARRRRGLRVGEPQPYYTSLAVSAEETPQGALPTLEAMGQLDAALIVAHSSDGHLYLVDQHRAHERLLYEALRREPAPVPALHALSEKGGSKTQVHFADGQLLLEPLVIELTTRQADILRARLDELAGLGMMCEPFGGATFLVRALPALPGASVGVASFASDLAVDAAVDADDWFEHVRVSLACRAALRRGQPLALAEQQALLADLRGAQAPGLCPHGSPILLCYTHSFLARAFEW